MAGSHRCQLHSDIVLVRLESSTACLSPENDNIPLDVRVPRGTDYFLGNGSKVIYIDWDKDIVAVVRWIWGGDALNEFLAKLLASIK